MGLAWGKAQNHFQKAAYGTLKSTSSLFYLALAVLFWQPLLRGYTGMSAWSCSVLEVMRGNPVQRITSTSLTFTEAPKAQKSLQIPGWFQWSLKKYFTQNKNWIMLNHPQAPKNTIKKKHTYSLYYSCNRFKVFQSHMIWVWNNLRVINNIIALSRWTVPLRSSKLRMNGANAVTSSVQVILILLGNTSGFCSSSGLCCGDKSRIKTRIKC